MKSNARYTGPAWRCRCNVPDSRSPFSFRFFIFSFFFFFLFSFFFFLFSCSSLQKIKQQNLSKIYRRNVSSLNPEFVVYHDSDSSSKVYFSIRTNELLYSKKESEDGFMAKVMIRYRLLESYESELIVDSATSYIADICRESDCSQSGRTEIIGDFAIKTTGPKKYLLEINTTDIYRNQLHTKYISIDKSSRNGGQNYLVRSLSTGLPLFKKNLALNEKVIIHHNDNSLRHFLCRFYSREFPIAPPPFAVYDRVTFDYQADSLFALSTDTVGNAVFEMNKKGFYHFLADSSGKSGLTLFYFGENFPEVGTADELILPLRYITTKKEFAELSSAGNKKESADKFWLGIGNSPERSKELIRQFYNRVQDANRFFTSYLEGWKTDRGMIYIVFGTPNVIYKTTETESWLYGEENNFMSISFNFYKVPNPFTDNDFLLERSPIYKANYFKAVDTWREGRVFTTN